MKNISLTQTVFQTHYKTISWRINYKNSYIRFLATQRNLISRPFSKIEGEFNVYTGVMQTTGDDFTDAAIDFSIVVNSINTGNSKRDRHLASSDFFGVNEFPVIKFRGVSFEKEKDNNYIMEGNCTIRDITKRLVFDVDYGGTKLDESGRPMAMFKASTHINRHEFGVKGNLLMETFIDKQVTILVNLEFARLS